MKKIKQILQILILILTGIFIVVAIFFALDLNPKESIGTKQENQNEIQQKEANKKENESNINVVPTMNDKIEKNTAWCGTFQLVWNDLKNDFAKQKIEFTPQIEEVENLNKEDFNTSSISEKSYFKAQGVPTKELKEQIEKQIEEKFNEKSEILDSFDFDGNPDKYFLYAMLKKEFEFKNEFEELEKGNFGDYEDVEYFGLNRKASEKVRNQIDVLYYNSSEDFAIKLNTKQDDEVIIAKGIEKNTFNEIYDEINKRKEEYTGDKEFTENDTLKIPNIKFDVKKEYKNLENKPFKIYNEDSYVIDKAIQTIEFELNKKGGKIKSEAGMGIAKTALINKDEQRDLAVDNTFTIFLKESNKDKPYFAANIENIKEFQ